MLPQFGSSTYFMLTLLSLVDFLSGFALRARRSARAAAGPSQGVLEAEAREPRVDPAPASIAASVSSPEPTGAPAAADIAEPVPAKASESAIVPGETTGAEQNPDVPSPGIQLGTMPSDQSRR
jgi:hypothetical protein